MEPNEGQESETMRVAASDMPTESPVTDHQNQISERWAVIQSAFREVRRLALAHNAGAAKTEVLD